MRKILLVAGSFSFTSLVFGQQKHLLQQSPGRISNLTNILIQNVVNTNLNNNNVQVISNPRPRHRIKRTRRSNISINNIK